MVRDKTRLMVGSSHATFTKTTVRFLRAIPLIGEKTD